MFCTNCGTELPDKANFCSNCSHPVHGALEGQPPPTYEFCTIRIRDIGWQAHKWQAWIGDAIIAESREFETYGGTALMKDLLNVLGRSEGHEKVMRISKEARPELASELMSQGWELFPPNQEYPTTFRRVKRV